MRSLSRYIKYVLRNLLLKVLPEVQKLNNPGNDLFLGSWIWDSKVSNKAKLYPLYHISQSMIEDYTYIARNSCISMTKIGRFCSIGPNLICGWGIHPTNGISTSPMFYSTMKQNGMTLSAADKIEERTPITIGNDVFIGANVTILDGVTIGDGAVIGAGAVVSKDIPPYAVAVGCPIQIIRYRFDEITRDKLLKIKWWEFGEEQLQDVEKMFFKVDDFIEKHTK